MVPGERSCAHRFSAVSAAEKRRRIACGSAGETGASWHDYFSGIVNEKFSTAGPPNNSQRTFDCEATRVIGLISLVVFACSPEVHTHASVNKVCIRIRCEPSGIW
ncbi:MAG: hypothetical protein DME18_15080 [Verrucomicrobia bacterium]|nr:MAG: hypothetical protein DME18_15080 [Verrucomicrobiota bacterium]